MASVAVIHAARLAASRIALECYALALAAVALWQLTWVHKVFANWAQVGLSGTWKFLSYAVLHTHLAVQLSLLVVAVAGIALVADALRALNTPRLLLR